MRNWECTPRKCDRTGSCEKMHKLFVVNKRKMEVYCRTKAREGKGGAPQAVSEMQIIKWQHDA